MGASILPFISSRTAPASVEDTSKRFLALKTRYWPAFIGPWKTRFESASTVTSVSFPASIFSLNGPVSGELGAVAEAESVTTVGATDGAGAGAGAGATDGAPDISPGVFESGAASF